MKKNFNFLGISVLLFCITVATVTTSKSQVILQGPLNPSAFSEEFGPCLSCPGSTWSNPQNVVMPDNMYATTMLSSYGFCFQTTCFYARALMQSGFGFSIPAAATITGIKAEVLRHASVNQAIIDTIVTLMKTGVTVGSNKAVGVFWQTSTLAYQAYGDSTDLWGTTWTPAEVNASTFGFFFKPENRIISPGALITASVDHIRITVYYQTPTGIAEQQSSDDNLQATYDAATHMIHLNAFTSGSGSAEVRLTDALGKIVFGKQLLSKQNKFETTIDCSAFSTGVYFVQFASGKIKAVKKIILQ